MKTKEGVCEMGDWEECGDEEEGGALWKKQKENGSSEKGWRTKIQWNNTLWYKFFKNLFLLSSLTHLSTSPIQSVFGRGGGRKKDKCCFSSFFLTLPNKFDCYSENNNANDTEKTFFSFFNNYLFFNFFQTCF